MNENPSRSTTVFTVLHDAIADVIYTEVLVGNPDKQPDKSLKVKALWDTGANGSCITERLAAKLGLKTEYYTYLTTASGMDSAPIYLVQLQIAEGLSFPEMEVSEFFLGEDESDLIIGMDIITQGDLAISNLEGKTMLSFRMPSRQHIDFSTFG